MKTIKELSTIVNIFCVTHSDIYGITAMAPVYTFQARALWYKVTSAVSTPMHRTVPSNSSLRGYMLAPKALLCCYKLCHVGQEELGVKRY